MSRKLFKPFESQGYWYWLKRGKHYQFSPVFTEQQDGSGLYPFGPDKVLERCPYGQAGDRIWVRETWHHILGEVIPDHRSNLAFRADYPECVDAKWDRPLPEAHTIKWVPSIHMPRWACRDVYDVIKVRVERLQDISARDAAAEGVELERWIKGEYPAFDPGLAWDEKILIDKFHALWDRLNGKKPGRAWKDNPWVWVVEYDNPLWGKA